MVVWKVKVLEFYFFVFNCLAKALIRHTYNVGETSRALFVLLTTCKTLLQIRAGITPQDVLTSIVALAIILCLNLTLFVATPLSKLQQYPWTTFRHCKYTCCQHFHLLKHKLLRANQKFLCSFALEKVLFCFVLELLTHGSGPILKNVDVWTEHWQAGAAELHLRGAPCVSSFCWKQVSVQFASFWINSDLELFKLYLHSLLIICS